jgi:hypothetical protein
MWLSLILVLPLCLLAWIPSEYQELIDSIQRDQLVLDTAFDTNVHVEARISYPKLPGTSDFIKYVNLSLEKDSHLRFNQFVQEMSIPQENVWEDEDNEYIFRYSLYPIYCGRNFISICGYEFRCLGSSHGSQSYVGKTFWEKDGTIHELNLDDLFDQNHKDRQFLFQYCENHFKSNKHGYYYYEDFSWVNFRPDHLDTFILTEKGLLLIFQDYVISGPDDYPSTLLIPYSILAHIANPDGPIPALLKCDDD